MEGMADVSPVIHTTLPVAYTCGRNADGCADRTRAASRLWNRNTDTPGYARTLGTASRRAGTACGETTRTPSRTPVSATVDPGVVFPHADHLQPVATHIAVEYVPVGIRRV